MCKKFSNKQTNKQTNNNKRLRIRISWIWTMLFSDQVKRNCNLNVQTIHARKIILYLYHNQIEHPTDHCYKVWKYQTHIKYCYYVRENNLIKPGTKSTWRCWLFSDGGLLCWSRCSVEMYCLLTLTEACLADFAALWRCSASWLLSDWGLPCWRYCSTAMSCLLTVQ